MGTKTAAVGRQYSGTTGRVENVIVAAYTTYATKRGHALIDRDLYVQADLFADLARMARAGFPKDHAFATKPALAIAQAKRALAAGITPQWATGDEVYGRSRELREFLEGAGIGYELVTRSCLRGGLGDPSVGGKSSEEGSDVVRSKASRCWQACAGLTAVS
ncbi:transposase [Streptomyces sp. enrichment culture]|uniref:transposase n=1 Tax=Streptomyces sp. enrichment culture TaxID=1795815 RepID=UPI003F56BC23